MTRINISNLISKNDEEQDFSCKIPEISPELKLVKPLAVSGKIINTDHGVLVRGEIKGEEIVACDRCTEYFNKKIEKKFYQEYIFPGNSEGEEIYEEKAGFIINDKKEIDLLEAVLEEVKIDDTIKNLCSKECKGICSSCGKNLNKGNCSCYTKKNKGNSFKKLEKLKER